MPNMSSETHSANDAAKTVKTLASEAMAHHSAGRLEEAVTAYRALLERRPDYAQVWNNLGVALKSLGRIEAALDAYRRTIDLDPSQANAYSNMSESLNALGRFEAAETAARAALALRPEMAEASSNLAVALMGQDRLDEAIAVCEEVVRRTPDYGDAYNNLGALLQRAERSEEALAPLRQAIALSPNNARAHFNLGLVYLDLKQGDASVAACRRAVELDPRRPDAWNNLGCAYSLLESWDEAIQAHRQALALDPGLVKAYAALVQALQKGGRGEEIAEICRKGMELDPDNPVWREGQGERAIEIGLADEGLRNLQWVIDQAPDQAINYQRIALAQFYSPNVTAAERFDNIRRWAALVEAGLVPAPFANRPDPDRRLRVGLVSGDFRNHPIAFFLSRFLGKFDPARIEIVCYATNKSCNDENSRQLQELTAGWRLIADLDDDQAAAQIREDDIDILVDLSGHTLHHRLGLFARRAAPVQVSWLGYCGSTGLKTMDYVLADRFVAPPGDEKWYTEKLWRLPGSYFCYDPLAVEVPIGPQPCLDGRGVRFGSFNNLSKTVDATLDLWAGVLAAVPNSTLLIKSRQLKDESVRDMVRRRLAARGVAPERVILEGWVPARLTHFESYNRIDIALDTHPYGGATTTCEALWMGVPVVSLRGDSWVGRMGESILSAVGLPQMVAATPTEYITLAAGLAANPEFLAALRGNLRAFVMASRLCDGEAFAADMDAAWRGMWREWCRTAGAAPG